MASKGNIIGLWFDNNADEAVDFYCSVFKDSSKEEVRQTLVENPSGTPVGSTLFINFTLNGQRFQALNGGPYFKFSEAISLIIECEDQAEMDYFYEHLSASEDDENCGWLKDKYGVSWQVVTKDLDKLMYGGDEAANKRVSEALLKMKRLDMAALEAAAKG